MRRKNVIRDNVNIFRLDNRPAIFAIKIHAFYLFVLSLDVTFTSPWIIKWVCNINGSVPY